ncbi:MAG: ferritin-like domain-containing protein [Anaerolineae bacterium]
MLEEPTIDPAISGEQARPDVSPGRRGGDPSSELALRRLTRYYDLAKRQMWSVSDLGWEKYPALPERHSSERWQGVWRSILTQLLQADEMAVKASVQLLLMAEHPTAKLYYTTMVQDEARHVEALRGVAGQVGELGRRNPYLDELAEMVWSFETLEERVVGIQGFFEALIIPLFHDIRRLAHDSVLGELCQRLAVDDGIHHGSGLAYADYLMARAPGSLSRKIERSMAQVYPVYMEFLTWRPPERAWLSRLMADRDRQVVHQHGAFIRRTGHRWNLEFAPD